MIASRSLKQAKRFKSPQKKSDRFLVTGSDQVNLYSYPMIVTRSGNKNQAITLIDRHGNAGDDSNTHQKATATNDRCGFVNFI